MFLAHERSGSHMHIGSVVAFLTPEQTLAVAIMSYNGGIDFGLLADYDAMDDVELIVDGIREAIAELSEAAQRVEAEAEAEPAAAG